MHYRFYITIALLLTAAIANQVFFASEAQLTRRPLSDFPKVIGDWKTVDEQQIGEGSMAVLQVDDYMMRTYTNKQGETIGLYIGYFTTQREGKQVHSPRQCLPGAGWGISESKTIRLKLKNHNPAEASINYYLMEKGIRKDLYLWWYQGRGRIYANEYLNKFYLMADAVTMRRTDGALVRINMGIKNNADDTMASELAFIDLIAPIISDYIPN